MFFVGVTLLATLLWLTHGLQHFYGVTLSPLQDRYWYKKPGLVSAHT
jgi:hypothetical protein